MNTTNAVLAIARPVRPKKRLRRGDAKEALGYMDGMSLYEYVGSNPADLTDPMGLCAGKSQAPVPNLNLSYPDAGGQSGINIFDPNNLNFDKTLFIDDGRGAAVPATQAGAGPGLVLTGPNGETVVVRNDGSFNVGSFALSTNVGTAQLTSASGSADGGSILGNLWNGFCTAYWFLRENGPKLVGSSLQGGDGLYSGLKVAAGVEGGGIWGFGAEAGVRVYGIRDTDEIVISGYFETSAGISTAYVGASLPKVRMFLGKNLSSADNAGGASGGVEAGGGLAVLGKVSGSGSYIHSLTSDQWEAGPNVSIGPGVAVFPPAGYAKVVGTVGVEGVTKHLVFKVPHALMDPWSLVDPYVPRPQ